MPRAHLVWVPVAVGLLVATWLGDLAWPRLPRPLFAVAVALPNAWLAAIGHVGVNLLFLHLLAAWVVFTGGRAAARAALALALAPLAVGALAEAVAGGRLSLSAWVPWTAGLLAIWALARMLVDQQHLLAENDRLRAEAEGRARELEVLYAQAQQAAALEARQRLARDLHDAATQSLYSARLHAEAALRLLAGGASDEAAACLREVTGATRDALAEMRLLIYELRPPVLEERGLLAALRQRLAAVEGRAGLETELVADPGADVRLPVAAEQELYRVAQEALNNALRHGRPGRIAVRLRDTPGAVSLEVADDGAGFDATVPADGGAGLPGMRERVARLGGMLAIESAPGQGTRVRVEVPR
jgi:signal transduction histidine kinase